MIRIDETTFDPTPIMSEYNPNSVQRSVLTTLVDSDVTYYYNSVAQLKFELNLRYYIVKASKELYKSRFSFEIFRNSKCNTKYWNRTDEGGFLLKNNAVPSQAIEDIYINSSKYGTECATAIVIVFYKAILDKYPEQLFNSIFPNIHLMNWHYIDSDLDIDLYPNQPDYFLGDCRYFKNPDVDPVTPEWQGENAIMLDNNLYYGHGIGIGTSDKMIHILNRFRKEDADESAYLMDSATRPNFKYLADIYINYTS